MAISSDSNASVNLIRFSFSTRNFSPIRSFIYIAGKTSPTQESDFDDVLEALAKKIPDDTINKLGKKLGFNAVEIGKYVATNSRYESVTCMGTLKMLRDWDIQQTKEKEGAALKKALNDAGLVRLAEEI